MPQVGHYNSERFITSISVPYMVSIRYGRFVFSQNDSRVIFIKYALRQASVRKAFASIGNFYSQRLCLKARCTNTHSVNRLLYTPPASVNFAIRYATYSLGSTQILLSFQVSAPIKYIDDRKALAATYPVSNRTVEFHYSSGIERIAYCCKRQETKMYTPLISSGVSKFSNRKITYLIGDFSQRNIYFTYTLNSEKQIIVAIYQEANIATTKVQVGINNLITDRKILVGHSYIHSNRKCWFQTAKLTERFIGLHYTIANERYATLFIGRINTVFTNYITPSKLVATERFGLTKGFAYITERYGYMEMRHLWYYKTPSASSPIITVRADKDKYGNIKIINDRPIETHGLYGVTNYEDYNKFTTIASTKYKHLTVSAVDNTGAMINSTKNKIKKLVASKTLFISKED